jgi:hypothetical protein
MSIALIRFISVASIVLMLVRPRGIPEYLWIGSGALAVAADVPAAVCAVDCGDICRFETAIAQGAREGF